MARFKGKDLYLKHDDQVYFGTSQEATLWYDNFELRLNHTISGTAATQDYHLVRKDQVLEDLISLIDTPGFYDDGKCLTSTTSGTVWTTVTGTQGFPGPQGPQGIQGDQGVQGPPGEDGGEWICGHGVPTTTGTLNNFYLDIDSGDIYRKESGTSSYGVMIEREADYSYMFADAVRFVKSGQEVIVDNEDDEASFTSGWYNFSNGNAWGGTCRYATTSYGAQGTFKFTVPEDGDYDVYAWWPIYSNAARSAPFAITHASGTTVIRKDQHAGISQWNYLSTHAFDGAAGWVWKMNIQGEDGEDSPTTFSGLTDTPNFYDIGKYLRSTSSGTEWHSISNDYYTNTEVNTISGTLQVQITDHEDDLDVHREINDSAGGLVDLWSANKIASEIATASGTTDHSVLNNLDYASSGHTGFTSSVDLATTSGSLQMQIDGKSDLGHVHDDRYYTEAEVDTISGSLQSNIDGVDHDTILNTHNLTTDVDHDIVTNTHNLTTDIDHSTITNTHNLTTDIDHDQISNTGTYDHGDIDTHIDSINNSHSVTLEQARVAGNIMTDTIFFHPTVNMTAIDVSGSNLDLVWMLGHNTDGYGYYWKYEGTGTGDTNYLYLYAENGAGADFWHLRYHQQTHELDIGSNLNFQSTYRAQFRDSDIYISSLTDGHLDLNADVQVDINTNLYVQNQFTIGGGTAVSIIRDEDDFGHDDANALVTQQSTKAYVDNEISIAKQEANIAIENNGTIVASGIDVVNFSNGFNVVDAGSSVVDVSAVTKIVECYNTSVLNVNVATPVAISWGGEDFKDDIYTHSNVTNNTRVGVTASGIYEISYCISIDNTANARRTVRSRICTNGSTYSLRGTACSYSRNSTDDKQSNTITVPIQLSANDYVEIMCDRQGSSGTANTIVNESFIYIKLIRYV